MSVDIVVALVAAAALVLGGILGLRGKRDEASAAQTKTLLDGQDKRIERLESRLDRVEKELSDTKVELTAEQTHSWWLRKYLRGAVEFVESVRLWDEGGRVGALPVFPPVDRWLIVLERPRRPPDK